MTFFNDKSEVTHNKAQKDLEKRKVWPVEGLKFNCSKPKCFNY